MFKEDEYNAAVDAQWLKLARAESNEELKEVLNTWPVREDYIIREEEEYENKDSSSSEE